MVYHRREKLVQTGVKYGWWVRLCVVNALTFRWWSRLLLGLTILSSAFEAAVVHSSNSHCLAHTSFGAPNSRPGVVDQRLLRRRTGAHQLRWDKADVKRHPAADMLGGGPTDKPGKRLPVSPTCKLKATDRELKSDTHWWNWLCFQQAYIKAFNRAFTVHTRYTHVTAYRHWSPTVSIKGMIVGRRGEGN